MVNLVNNDKGYMKIKFNSDDNLPLNKVLKYPMLTLPDLFSKKMVNTNHKFSQMNVCMKYKGQNMIVIFCDKECDIFHYWHFVDKNFNYDRYLRNGCYNLMQKL